MLFGYASGSFMCIDHKLYMMLGLLVISAITYYITERTQRRLEEDARIRDIALQRTGQSEEGATGSVWIVGQSVVAAALRSRPSIISLELPYSGALLARMWPATQESQQSTSIPRNVLYESTI